MTIRALLFACLILAACNPAAVDPPAAADSHAANLAAPATGVNEAAPVEDEPEFAATGAIPCVTRARWRLRDCTVGVVRNRDGSATVTVFHPEGRSRDILFDASGRATGVRTAEQDGSDRQPFSASRAANATIVRLGPERYEVPDILIQGD